MTVAWYRFRHTLRRRWIGYLAVALLIAVLGGVSLASIAGARRTSSALHRFMVASNPSDMATVIGPYDQEFIDAIARFPQVVGVRTWVGFLVAPLDAKGAPILDATVEDGEWVGSVDGFYFD